MEVRLISPARLICLCVTAGLMSILATAEVMIVEPAGTSMSVSAGDTINLKCASSDGAAIQWSHKGMPVIESGERSLTEITDANTGARTLFLSIEDAEEDDGGMYTCSNPEDYFDKDEVEVTITGSEPGRNVEITDPADDEVDVEAGRSFTLTCIGDENAEIQWLFNGMGLETSSRVIITTARDVNDRTITSILTRNHIDANAAGTYTCSDMGDYFNRDEIEVRVDTSGPSDSPVNIVEPPGSVLRVTTGASFTLRCRGDTDTDLQWYKDDTLVSLLDTPFIINAAQEPDTGNQISLLTKEDATEDDSGDYACKSGMNSENGDTVSVTVGSHGPGAAPAPTESRTLVLRVGSSINLRCSMETDEDHLPEWSKDGQVLESGNKFTVKHTELKILDAERTDAGVYRCTFKNMESGHVAGIVVFNLTTTACPGLEAPVNGSFDRCPEDPVYGDTCTFQCQSGFKLSSNQPLVCEMEDTDQSTHWSDPVPTCKGCSAFDLFGCDSGSRLYVSHWILGIVAFLVTYACA